MSSEEVAQIIETALRKADPPLGTGVLSDQFDVARVGNTIHLLSQDDDYEVVVKRVRM